MREAAFDSNTELEFAPQELLTSKRELLDKSMSEYFNRTCIDPILTTHTMDSCKDPVLVKQYNMASLSLDVAIKQFVREHGSAIKSSTLHSN